MKLLRILGAIVAALVLASFAYADDFTPISMPTSSYTSSTSLISVTQPLGSYVNSLSDGTVSVNFSSPMEVVEWSPWGVLPYVENTDQIALYDDSQAGCGTWPQCSTTLTVNGTAPGRITTLGFEITPDSMTVQTYTVNFYDGTQLVGSVVRTVDGTDTGTLALLFAASTDTQFTSVVVSGDSPFAIANIRYIDPVDTPEPASFALLLSGGIAVLMRRRRR